MYKNLSSVLFLAVFFSACGSKSVLLDPILAVGETTVRFNAAGDNDNNFSFYVSSFFPDKEDSHLLEAKSEDGLTFTVLGTSVAYAIINDSGDMFSFFISPGDTVDIFKRDNGTYYVSGPSIDIGVVDNFIDYNRSFSIFPHIALDSLQGESMLIRVVDSAYNEAKRDIRGCDSLGAKQRESYLLMLDYEAADFLMMARDFVSRNEDQSEIIWKEVKNYAVNCSKAIYAGQAFKYFINSVRENKPDLYASDEGFIGELLSASDIPESLSLSNRLSIEQRAALKGLSEPFYLNVCEYIQEELDRMAQAAQGVRTPTIPQVPDDELFDAISIRYAGKTALVDFWATWCLPCMKSIRWLEPFKDKLLSNGDLAFIYITDESSPLAKWNETIPGIKGDHYRISTTQWQTLLNKFGINAIPSYVLIGSNGTYELRNDLRDHNKLLAILDSD